MGINDWEEKAEESSPDRQGRSKSCGCDELRATVADRIHKVAEALRENAAEEGVQDAHDKQDTQDARSGAAHYRNQAAEWLDRSAEYIEQFDYRQADARFREYVKQSPERSLLIAGAVGLIIGAVWRRR